MKTVLVCSLFLSTFCYIYVCVNNDVQKNLLTSRLPSYGDLDRMFQVLFETFKETKDLSGFLF